jgi:hypothetical protein
MSVSAKTERLNRLRLNLKANLYYLAQVLSQRRLIILTQTCRVYINCVSEHVTDTTHYMPTINTPWKIPIVPYVANQISNMNSWTPFVLFILVFPSCIQVRSFLTVLQRPRKHFESGGALAKRGTFVYDQNQTILCRSRAERKFLKIWSLYDVGNGLYRVFTAAKKALSFQQKRAFSQEILFFVL